MKDIIIKNSKISGKGVFANRDFKKGEVIVNHKSKEISLEEYKRLSQKRKKFVGVNGKKYFIFFPSAKYVNHSCNPNTKVKNNADVAIKNIQKGEEITTYYKDDDPTFSMVCNCGSKNCRRIIKNL